MNNLKKEDGYILIVIVGILTVFSLMAITFATLSRVEIKATRNYADSVKCEAVAKAGLEHALYTIRQDKFGTDTTVYNDDGGGDTNYDSLNNASWPGNGIFPGGDYDNDGDSTPDSQWIDIPGTTTATSAIRLPGNLRARYAVLITDDREARVNINATGNRAGAGNVHTSNEGWSTFEIDLADLIERQAPGQGINTTNRIIDVGNYARHGADSDPGNAGDDDPGKIPDPQADDIDNDGDLIVDEADEVTNEPGEFNPISPIGDDVPFDILAEAEIMGTSTYTSKLEEIFTDEGISQPNQEILKGWLTTYSADTILCPEYQLDGVGTSTKLNINALIYNEGAYTGGYYDSDKKVEMIIDVLTAGGVPPVERQQMAVNIKDFIDTDSNVTNYLTYYGVEKTPYINEVEAKPQGANPEFIELYNPYDTAIFIEDWTITGTTMGTVTIDPGTIIFADSYYVIGDFFGAGVDQIEFGMNLEDNGEQLTLKDNLGNTVQVTDYENASTAHTSSLNDPRPPWSWTTNVFETIGAPNDNFDPTDGSDGWTLGTFSSSFLIANRRFSNKGYLGYIHTGSQWTSFRVGDTVVNPISYPNLLQYITITDPSMDNIDNDGDVAIDTADTGLQPGDVDGQEYRIPGLINVNTAAVEVLDSLPNITNAIATDIATSGGKPFESIGDLVAKVPAITGALPKWNEEEALRSISNLITTRSNVFTVYVTAQVTDDAGSRVFAEKRIMAIVDRSVDPIRVRYFRWITTP